MAEYGLPKESRGGLRTLTLDLPVEIGSVEDPSGDNPPIKVYGPYDEDIGEDLEEYDPVVPVAVDIDGNVVEFTFPEQFTRGLYQAVVHQSRIYRASDGQPVDLETGGGKAWRGWQFEVLAASVGNQAATGNQRTISRGRERSRVRVFLDGDRVPEGSAELSGEVLTVETTEAAEVELETDCLLDAAQREPLHSKFLAEEHGTKDVAGETVHLHHFAAAGPIGQIKWAEYHGTSTVAKLVADRDGPKVGVPVVRPPKKPGTDPLLSREEETQSPSTGHPNSYTVVHYCAEPQTPGLDLTEYRPPPVVGPETINDDNNTPATNPRLYPDGIYREDADELPSSELKAAVFDLPLNSEVRVKINGRVRWWGQTRLIPVLVSPHAAESNIEDLTADTREAQAKLLRSLWSASMEALHLWGGPLPTDDQGRGVVVSTMRKYVLTRVAIGPDYEEGVQGSVQGTMGQQSTSFSAQGDRAMRRRLFALAQRLKDAEETAPVMPEDDLPTAHATVGKDAGMSMNTGRGRHSRERLVPTYDAFDLSTFFPAYRQRRDLWKRFDGR